MFVDVIRVRVMQMTPMKIVNMAIVPNGFVSAIRPMLVGMSGMVIGGATCHECLSFVRGLAMGMRRLRRLDFSDRYGIAGREALFQRFIEEPIDMCVVRRRIGLVLSISGFC